MDVITSKGNGWFGKGGRLIKPDPLQRIDIVVPQDLTSQSVVKGVLERLPIVRRHSKNRYLEYAFAPRKQLRQITFDCSNIIEADASGICDFLGLVSWLKAQSDNVRIEVRRPRQSYRAHIAALDSAFEGNLAGDLFEKFLLPPTACDMPVFAAASSPEGKDARDFLVKWADRAMTSLHARAHVGDISESVSDVISTALVEGLLNAYEHAYYDLDMHWQHDQAAKITNLMRCFDAIKICSYEDVTAFKRLFFLALVIDCAKRADLLHGEK